MEVTACLRLTFRLQPPRQLTLKTPTAIGSPPHVERASRPSLRYHRWTFVRRCDLRESGPQEMVSEEFQTPKPVSPGGRRIFETPAGLHGPRS